MRHGKAPALKLPTAELPNPQIKGATRLDVALATGHADPAMEAWAIRKPA